MTKYIFIESRDPFESRDTRFVEETAIAVKERGHDVTLFLVQNGVLAARKGAGRLGSLAEAGVTLLAYDLSLRERGIKAEELARGVHEAGIDMLVEAIVQEMGEATEEDWHTEYLAPILSVRVVSGLDQAIEHIALYGSQHTDSIITEDYGRARCFLREVDSSSVMVNASTRFADGFEYGLGAEIGISTDKIHARGPVGLEGLTSQKFIVLGDGHVRQ